MAGVDALAAGLAGDRPLVMGVLNVTPDSFSDGGRFDAPDAARERARAMLAEGADIIDVGGESTRPGASGVDTAQERARVIPLIESLAALDCPLSVDTSKPAIMSEAAAAGVAMINDVRALRAEGAVEAAAATELPVCLMHMLGEPRTMQEGPRYEDVVREVGDFLAERVDACLRAGIARARIVVDPGFGFGKTLEHNLTLLANLGRLHERLGLPILVGMSRKRTIGELTGRPVDERLAGSIAVATIAVLNGAHIVRAHDVAATRDAVAVAHAIGAARGQP